jgi:multisubunit Na+/H+ antiporter MnhB subunit
LNGGTIIGITVVAIMLVLYEWPRIKPGRKKEKAALIGLTLMGWSLSIALLFFPNLPGPTQLVDALFRPLGQIFPK